MLKQWNALVDVACKRDGRSLFDVFNEMIQWSDSIFEEPYTFDDMILSGIMPSTDRLNNLHFPPVSSPTISIHSDMEVSPDEDFRCEVETSITKYVILVV